MKPIHIAITLASALALAGAGLLWRGRKAKL